MTPPASVEPVVLWRYPNCGQWSRGPVVLGHDKRAPDNVNYCAEGRWLPVAAYTALMARIERAEALLNTAFSIAESYYEDDQVGCLCIADCYCRAGRFDKLKAARAALGRRGA